MKRNLLSICLYTTALMSHAVMANREPATIYQPDGTALEITLHGDEHMSWLTTSDGFPVVRDDDKFLKYACLKGDSLVSTSIIAHNPTNRTFHELKFLSTFDRRAVSETLKTSKKTLAINETPLIQKADNYTGFKGLVILVEFNDCKFSRNDIATIFTDMISQPDYKGFKSDSGEMIKYTGSVRDYFFDNSSGRFDPQFDVIGPVTIDYPQTYPCAAENNHIIIPAALNAADPLIDYSLYDTDGDGTVEMVYLIFAGAGSNFAGNNGKYLWPHAAQIASVKLDGVRFGRYACSTEFYGRESDRIIDGIGTICHEFSHVLGLPDLYDTDYSTNGQSITPEDWSLMAGGSYLNFARTPCCMSMYERYAIGFATPETISDSDTYSLQAISSSNTGYRINSAIDKEFFIIENRQNVGWDEYLPGHGMLVFRVDSTNAVPWNKNQVNANASRNYYELLRATQAYNDNGTIKDGPGDPFPGNGNVCELTNTTIPSIRSWTGMETGIILTDITELPDGTISFRATTDHPDMSTEDFERCHTTMGQNTDISGNFCIWTLADGASVTAYATEETGQQAVAMIMGSSLTSSVIDKEVDFIKVDIINPTNYTTTIKCMHSPDDGSTWETIKTLDNLEEIRLSAKSRTQAVFKAATAAGGRYRFVEEIGNKTSYINNISFLFTRPYTSSIDNIEDDTDGTFDITLNGGILLMTCPAEGTVDIYHIDGRKITSVETENHRAVCTLPSHGIYIIKQKSYSTKLIY